MKIFLVVFATIVLTFVGKSAFAHTFPNTIKYKFHQNIGEKVQYFNAIEEEEISEDIHEEKDKVSSSFLVPFISRSYFSSESRLEISLTKKFDVIKSHLLALYKQFANYRI